MNTPEAATPHDQLISELLDSRILKTEREHAAAEEIARLKAENQRLRSALESISKNTCCSTCQEAALVAKAALKQINEQINLK